MSSFPLICRFGALFWLERSSGHAPASPVMMAFVSVPDPSSDSGESESYESQSSSEDPSPELAEVAAARVERRAIALAAEEAATSFAERLSIRSGYRQWELDFHVGRCAWLRPSATLMQSDWAIDSLQRAYMLVSSPLRTSARCNCGAFFWIDLYDVRQ